MKIALVGNPNSGKTTLFNEITHLNQKVGNWSGVTVERKQGKYTKDKSIDIIDLPGVYSFNAITQDETIAVNYLLTEKPEVAINVIDSTNLERSLHLTLQLLELDIPVVLALNMEDELKLHGLEINAEAIENELKVPAIKISAKKNRNIGALMEKAIDLAKTERKATFKSKGKTEEEKAESRNNYIHSKIDSFRTKEQGKHKAQRITESIDKIVLNRWLAFPIFAVIIWLMYFVSIQSIGALSIEFMEWLFDDVIGAGLDSWLTSIGASAWVVSLVVDGIVAGVGTVLSFVPQIVILFLFITLLEGLGYMARIAVIMDRIFKKLGLSGKSFIPMIVGCGCSVPAIMSCKTIEGENERKTTMLLTPFIPCSAKLPVFALIAGALFPHNSFVAPSMYFLGIFMVIVCGLVLKMFNRRKGEQSSLFIELPHYRLPKVQNILIELWEKASGFITRAGKIIVPVVILIWFLQSFNFSFQAVDAEDSILAILGKGISWLFYPLGFGGELGWIVVVALIVGMMAKEAVVAVFGTLLAVGGLGLSDLFTPQSAYAFMAFILLSAPCIAAVATIKRETGSTKFMLFAVGFQCAVAYIVALLINQAGNLWEYDSTLCISILTIAVVALVFAFTMVAMIKNRKKGRGCATGCAGCAKSESCAITAKE